MSKELEKCIDIENKSCDISFDEMLNILDEIPGYKEPTEEEKQKAREHIESLFAKAKTYSNSRGENKDESNNEKYST